MGDDTRMLGRIKDKLIQSKQKWAEEGRLLTGRAGRPDGQRLPPGQRQVKDWPVLDIGLRPQISRDDWRLTVDGAVETPLNWTWDDFMQQPIVEDVSDIHCVTAWSRFDNRWRGVAGRHLLTLVRPLAGAKHIIFHAYDGYTTNLRLEMFDDDDTLLAFEHDGQPIPAEHGGPVRVVVPKYYFWKSAKWVRRIEFSPVDRPGFWEVRGYHNDGEPWDEQRYG